MLGWYFSNNSKQLRYGDGRKIRPGITHKVTGVPFLCQWGLHASKNIVDALIWAPGLYIWRVELSGQLKFSSDKMVASERKYLWGYRSEDIFKKFLRLCAYDLRNLLTMDLFIEEYLRTGDPEFIPFALEELKVLRSKTRSNKRHNVYVRLLQQLYNNFSHAPSTRYDILGYIGIRASFEKGNYNKNYKTWKKRYYKRLYSLITRNRP